MKVLVVNPPWIVGGRSGVRAGSRWPHLKLAVEDRYMPFPFFMAYATSLLKHHKIKVKAIDAIAECMDENTFLEKVRDFQPTIVMSEISTPSLQNDIHILEQIKKETGALICVAGPDISILDKRFLLDSPIDISFSGEYEAALFETVQAIESKRSLLGIKGLVFKQKNKVFDTGNRELMKDIDGLPWPDREDFPLERYHDCPGGIPEPSGQMWGSRGCPYRCKFCAWPQLMYHGNTYRPRDHVKIVDEMEYLVKTRKMRSIYFDDDTFNIGKARMILMGKELYARRLNVPWAFMGRADLADREYMAPFRDTGLSAVKYGMESGVQELVDRSNKRLDLERAIKNIKMTKELGIKVHLTFTFGLPGETKETIRRTIRLASQLDPDSVQFSIATPFPGTVFYDEMKKNDMLVSRELSDYDGNTRSVIRTEKLTAADLEEAQRQAYSVWEQRKVMTQRYSKLSPFKLFTMCLRENGLPYTIRKTMKYLGAKNYMQYLKSRKHKTIRVD